MASTRKDSTLWTQLSSFLGVGIFTAIIDATITFTLTHFGLHRNAAKAVGWVFGTAAAYLLNSRFTFKTKVTKGKALAVFLLYASTFGIQNLLYWATNGPLLALGFDGLTKDIISFVIAQGVATVTNFVLQRTVVFRERRVPVVVEDVPPYGRGETK
ncbi:hypothetical protein B841_01145 [Corynebacterium maris DSM 45190]|uniref:GtrA/DPMS transmembrane domain-containing protein n=1 Tax=Corynebacterium maris DSM 45190 TaxID=1224163 RepID=S5SRR7_9CORY|nr:GtrA family protein [Corynebacterium maris]AGS33712.1 hypothetical protein B841_01145 [Corynebacterium maris DSM 45190]